MREKSEKEEREGGRKRKRKGGKERRKEGERKGHAELQSDNDRWQERPLTNTPQR